MKIVDTDNFRCDYPNERFVAENIPSKEMAETMCQALNRQGGDDSPRFYFVAEDNYVLVPGFEP